MTAVFEKILEMSLAASVTIIVLLVMRLVLRRAPRRAMCALWAIVAIQLVLPLSIKTPFSLQPADSGAVIEEWADDYYGEARFIHNLHEDYAAAVEAGREEIATGGQGSYVVTAADGVSAPPTVRSTLVPILSCIWAAGMAALCIHAAASWLGLRRMTAVSAPWRDNVLVCDNIPTPFIFGIFSPRIYVPSSMGADSLESVLAHERAHLSRGDHFWKPLAYMLLMLHWFNPLVWLAYILFCRDLEQACDERVIRDMDISRRKGYSRALVECSLRRGIIAACPLAFGETAVKTRIKGILGYKRPALITSLAAVLAAVVLTGCFLTKPLEEPAEEAAPDGISVPDEPENIPEPTATPAPVIEDIDPVTRLDNALGTLTEGTAARLILNENGSLNKYGFAMDDIFEPRVPNSKNFNWVPVDAEEGISAMSSPYENDQKFKIILEPEDSSWQLTCQSGSDYASFTDKSGTYYFSGAWKDTGQYPYGAGRDSVTAADALRIQYDNVEFQYIYHYGIAVVEDRGQTAYEAAVEGCSTLANAYINVNKDSIFSYSFVDTRVRIDEEHTNLMRELGEYDENTWRFHLETAFVPSNEYALYNSMAGNTGPCTWEDAVHLPEGVMMYGRVGTVTQTFAGWEIIILGTG